MMSGPAPAKINLALHVLGRRADGYHVLDSLVVFAGIGDRLTVEPAGNLTLALTGPFGAALAAEPDNLVLRAARALAGAAGIPARARIVLDKRLPVASGIGGGSADAAAALRLLRDMWSVDVPDADLTRIGLQLGADVPVCLHGRPVRMGGIGEVLAAVPALPVCGLVLVNPGVAVATPAVFRHRTGPFSAPLSLPPAWADAAALADWLRPARNDLQPPAVALEPRIGDVLSALDSLPGCLLARMSGSGATCFALFGSLGAAEASAGALAGRGWWVWGGGLAAAD